MRYEAFIRTSALVVSMLIGGVDGLALAQSPVLNNNVIELAGSWRIHNAQGDGDDYWIVIDRTAGLGPIERHNVNEDRIDFPVFQNGRWDLRLEIESNPAGCNDSPPCSEATILPLSGSGDLFQVTARTDDAFSDLRFTLERLTSCVPRVDPQQAFVRTGGGFGWFQVTAPPDCLWTATSSDAAVTILSGSVNGRGSFPVGYTVAPNANTARREFDIEVKPDAGSATQAVRFRIEQVSANTPQLQLTAATTNFGSVVVNSEQRQLSFVVTNVGTEPVTLTGANDCPQNGFRVLNKPTPTPGITLAVNQSRTFEVEFAPRFLGARNCELSFSPDPTSSVMFGGIGLSASNALGASTNAAMFSAGGTLRVAARLTPGANPVDAYIVLQLPGGQLLSLQAGGGLMPGVVPIARSVVPLALEVPLLQYTLDGSEPIGVYTWLTALTRAGTLELVSPLFQTTFSIVSTPPQ